MSIQERKLKTANCIAYGLGDMYGGGSFFLISAFVMYYLVAVVGMSPILAGLVPGLGKIWDAVSDPLMGYLSDHTKAKSGRRRIWFLVGIVPIFISFVLIWLPVPFTSDLSLFMYYFCAYLVFYTVSTMVMVPYGALSAEMTTDYKERNKLTGFRMLFSILATLLAGVAAQPIINMFPDPRTGHLMMSLVFGTLFALPWVFVFFGTWELPRNPNETSDDNFVTNFLSIFKNRSFIVQICMYIAAYGAMDLLMNFFKFYLLDYLLKGEGFVTIALGSLLITEIIVLPFYIMLSNKKGHAFSFKTGMVIWIIAMICMVLQTPSTPTIFVILNCILIGAGLGAGVIIPFQLLPFVTDVDELISTRKRAGTYAGAMTLIRKLIQGALVIPVVGILLTAINYLGPLPERFTKEQFTNEIVGRIQNTYTGGVQSTMVSLAEKAYPATTIWTKDTGYVEYRIINPALEAKDKSDLRKAMNAIDYKGFGASKKTVNVSQDASTVSWIRLLFVSCPVLFILAGFIAAFFFKITPENHSVLMKEIERLSKGGKKEDVTSDTKKVCEMLSGMPYEKLYKA